MEFSFGSTRTRARDKLSVIVGGCMLRIRVFPFSRAGSVVEFGDLRICSGYAVVVVVVVLVVVVRCDVDAFRLVANITLKSGILAEVVSLSPEGYQRMAYALEVSHFTFLALL